MTMSDLHGPTKLVNRRLVLMLGAAGGFAAFGPSPRSFAKDGKGQIKVAVKYSMIREAVSVRAKFETLKSAGFQGVEITIGQRKEVKEILRAVDATGVVVHGVVHGTSDNYEEPLNLCKGVGGDSVLVVARLKPKVSYDENFKLAQRYLSKAIPQAEKLGVRLLVENVRDSFLKKAEEMARFIDELKSPAVGAYFDTGNAITWTDQSAEHWVRVLGNRIVKLDVKDRGHVDFGDPKKRSPDAVGADGGEVHWKNVRNELERIKFGGWATAETKGGGEARLKRMAHWMRGILRLRRLN